MFLAWSPDSRTIAAAVLLPEGLQQERILVIDTTTGGAAHPLIDAPVSGGSPTNIRDGHRAGACQALARRRR